MCQQILVELPNNKFYSNTAAILRLLQTDWQTAKYSENNGRVSSAFAAKEPKCNLGLQRHHIYVSLSTTNTS